MQPQQELWHICDVVQKVLHILHVNRPALLRPHMLSYVLSYVNPLWVC